MQDKIVGIFDHNIFPLVSFLILSRPLIWFTTLFC